MKRPGAGRQFRGVASVVGALAVAAWSAPARAQAPAPPGPDVPAVTPAVPEPPPREAAPTPPAPLPPPEPPAKVTAADVEQPVAGRPATGSDLDVEARRWAIGYAGFSQVPVGLTPTASDITVPAIGFRYWSTPTFGVDLALGFSWAGGSSTIGGSSVDKNSTYGFIVQGGLPFALSTHRHVSFQVIPFVAIAHGRTSMGTGVNTIDFSGTRADIGARAGFELFFGFIGIPELALSTTVGVQFEVRRYNGGGGGTDQSDTTLGVSTTVQNNPWDIFAGNVAARYYF